MPTPDRFQALAAVGRAHLPPAVGERWIPLLRPGLRLRHAVADEPVAAHLGGLPGLPDGVPWPVCEGHGPLGFVGAIDCGALPPAVLDIPLPAAGTLLLFYFGDVDDQGRIGDRPADTEQNRAIREWAEAKGIEVFTPDYWPEHPHVQTRVVHVPAGVPVTERAAPAGRTPYPRVPLAAEPIATAPDWSHPALRAATADLSDADLGFLREYNGADPLRSALWEHATPPRHRIGGYAFAVQDAVETPPWTLLAQIDSDDAAGMLWGDVGTLYWLIRPDDLAAGRFDRVSFTWQCS